MPKMQHGLVGMRGIDHEKFNVLKRVYLIRIISYLLIEER